MAETSFNSLSQAERDRVVEETYFTSTYTLNGDVAITSDNQLIGSGTLTVTYDGSDIEDVEYFTSIHKNKATPVTSKTFTIPKDCQVWVGLTKKYYMQANTSNITHMGLQLTHSDIADKDWTSSEKGSYRTYTPSDSANSVTYAKKASISGDLDIIRAASIQVGEYNNFQVGGQTPQWAMTTQTEQSLGGGDTSPNYGTNKYGVDVMALNKYDDLRFCLTQTTADYNDYIGIDSTGRWLTYVRGTSVYHLHSDDKNKYWHVNLYQSRPSLKLTYEKDESTQSQFMKPIVLSGGSDISKIYYTKNIEQGWRCLPLTPNNRHLFTYPHSVGRSHYVTAAGSLSNPGVLITLPLFVEQNEKTTPLMTQSETTTVRRLNIDSTGFMTSLLDKATSTTLIPNYLPRQSEYCYFYSNHPSDYLLSYQITYLTDKLSLVSKEDGSDTYLIPQSLGTSRPAEEIGEVKLTNLLRTDDINRNIELHTEVQLNTSSKNVECTTTTTASSGAYVLLQYLTYAVYEDTTGLYHRWSIDVDRTITTSYQPCLIEAYLSTVSAIPPLTAITAPQLAINTNNQLTVYNPNDVDCICIYDEKTVDIDASGKDLYDQRYNLTKAVFVGKGQTVVLDASWCYAYFVGDNCESAISVKILSTTLKRQLINGTYYIVVSGDPATITYGVGDTANDAEDDLDQQPKTWTAKAGDKVSVNSNEYFAYSILGSTNIDKPPALEFTASRSGTTTTYRVNRAGTLYYTYTWGDKTSKTTYSEKSISENTTFPTTTTTYYSDTKYDVYAYFIASNGEVSNECHIYGDIPAPDVTIVNYDSVTIANNYSRPIYFGINNTTAARGPIAVGGTATASASGDVTITTRYDNDKQSITMWVPSTESEIALITTYNDTNQTITVTSPRSEVAVMEGLTNRGTSYTFAMLPGALLYAKIGYLATTATRYCRILPPTFDMNTWLPSENHNTITAYNPNKVTVKREASGYDISANASYTATNDTYFYYSIDGTIVAQTDLVSIPRVSDLSFTVKRGSNNRRNITYQWKGNTTYFAAPTVTLHYQYDGDSSWNTTTLTSGKAITVTGKVTAYLTYTNSKGTVTTEPITL